MVEEEEEEEEEGGEKCAWSPPTTTEAEEEEEEEEGREGRSGVGGPGDGGRISRRRLSNISRGGIINSASEAVAKWMKNERKARERERVMKETPNEKQAR